MSNFKEGQKLIYTPVATLDEPYADEEEVVYVGRSICLGKSAVKNCKGFVQIVEDINLSKVKVKIPFWKALKGQLLKDYSCRRVEKIFNANFIEDKYNLFELGEEGFIQSLRELGVDIPDYVEVDSE